MGLRDYAALVRRRLAIVVAVPLGALVVAGVGTLALEPSYSAETTLRTATGVSISDGVARPDDAVYLDRLKNTYGQIAKSDLLVRELVRDLRLDAKPAVAVEQIPNTELMRLIVTADRPHVAIAAANRLAKLLIDDVNQTAARDVATADAQFESRIGRLDREIAAERREHDALPASGKGGDARKSRRLQLELDMRLKEETAAALREERERYRLARLDRAAGLLVLEPAASAATATPSRTKILALALFVGVLGGIGLAFLSENLSTRLRGKEQIEAATDVPVMGVIPTARAARENAVFNGSSAAEEAFHRLATNVLAASPRTESRTILVTSAEPGEGKSTIVANLGRALAEAGSTVLVVDADLRRPRLHATLGASGEPGLLDVLSDTPLRDALQATPVPRLFFLASGGSVSTPASSLRSPELPRLIAKLQKQFEIVLIDAPAVLGVTDALILAPLADEVLLVVRENLARREMVRAARDQLAAVNVVPLGVVVNRAHAFEGQRYYEQLAREVGRRGSSV